MRRSLASSFLCPLDRPEEISASAGCPPSLAVRSDCTLLQLTNSLQQADHSTWVLAASICTETDHVQTSRLARRSRKRETTSCQSLRALPSPSGRPPRRSRRRRHHATAPIQMAGFSESAVEQAGQNPALSILRLLSRILNVLLFQIASSSEILFSHESTRVPLVLQIFFDTTNDYAIGQLAKSIRKNAPAFRSATDHEGAIPALRDCCANSRRLRPSRRALRSNGTRPQPGPGHHSIQEH